MPKFAPLHPNNEPRADRIDKVLAEYQRIVGDYDPDVDGVDYCTAASMLSDMRHWAQRAGVPWKSIVNLANDHFQSEKATGD